MKAWREKTQHLPISQHLAPIAEVIQAHQLASIEAPPGSGKTTLLPLHLLDQPWLHGKKILVLQPRRVAARSVAQHMARLLGEPVGETVGFHVRMERVTSSRTRIEVITEGLLTRRLVSSPDLPDVGAIIFDEFHERSIHSDLAFSIARECAETLRPDLKLIVMSATLGAPESLPGLAVTGHYSFQGTPHPLELLYRPAETRVPVWESAAGAALQAVSHHEGDILVFLAGRYEIERTHEILAQRRTPCIVRELYGEMPFDDQQHALYPDPSGRRKIILSTPIAETSLTIEGVRVVIDTGYHKVSRDNGGTSELRTERITSDAATQRAGRAARTASGVCIRLWSEHEHRTLRAHREPEVLRADLTPASLDLAAWGVVNPSDFAWLTPPPAQKLSEAASLLERLGALDTAGRITASGRILASLGLHPRLGTMCIAARACGLESLCAMLITSLEERRSKRDTVDISSELELRSLSPRLRDVSQQWLSRLRTIQTAATLCVDVPEQDAPGYLLAVAYPDRIARRREPASARYLLANGQGAALAPTDPLRRFEYLVVPDVQANSADDLRIARAVPLNADLLTGALSGAVTTSTETSFDKARGALMQTKRKMCGAIVLSEQSVRAASSDDSLDPLLSYLSSEEGFKRIPFSSHATSLRKRLSWLSTRTSPLQAPLPDLSDAALRSTLSTWLAPFLSRGSDLDSLSSAVIDEALQALVPWSVRSLIEREAPLTFVLPSGKPRPVVYDDHDGPTVEVYLQDLFGLTTTPCVGSSRTPLTLILLSPARRPVQKTKDLISFWKGAYHEVRKELRGRYPKHRWPEDPTKP